ncbi:hypothetical protein [Breoghania sp. L-A4]|uniref:hypothetical protein n=1 Tax=Breoghania sp. L-A4 TaxID=2304600 RepID=UPI000E35C269|nr:hypothetical protein [Breoghania sp. L-A4]AXS39928.1 hypothetical protein D1F64_07500 [Breoghania sp. L-A4]
MVPPETRIARLRLGRLAVRRVAEVPAAPSGPSALARQKVLVDSLRRALEGERSRGRAGHWSFDANRCLGLERAYREASDALDRLNKSEPR